MMRVWAAVSLSVLASCGGGGGSSGDGNVTMGDLCNSTGMAFCSRLMACNVGTSASCFSAFVDSCCTRNGTCGRPFTGMAAAQLDAYEMACDSAFQAEACSDVAAGTVPSACSSLPN
jgi:hypothetical protein